MKLRNKVISLVGISALVLPLAACNGNGVAGGTNSEPGTAGNGAASSGETANSNANAVANASPLQAILNQVWGTDVSLEEQQRRLEEQALQKEELIAKCMNEAGFEYIPNPNTAGHVTAAGDSPWRPDDRDWVTQYGYGLTVSPFGETTTYPEDGSSDTWFDPNSEFVNSLSDSEREAYYEALSGPPFDFGSVDVMTDEIWAQINENSGCAGWARQQVDANSPSSIMASDEFLPIRNAIDEFQSNLENRPEFAELDHKWAECMADAGHPGLNRNWDARGQISTELESIWANIGANWDWDQGAPTPANYPALAEIANREVETALTDLGCRESVHLRSRQAELTYAAEQQFVADHRAELAALLSAIEQRG